MDLPCPEHALAEAYRVLRPGGFLQFSIVHPCFGTPHRRNLRDGAGRTYGFEVGRYFEGVSGEIEQWIFGAAPAELRAVLPKFRVPLFHRPLSWWLNTVLGARFQLERVEEPRPDDATVARWPSLQDAQVAAYFLHLRVRKGPAPV